MLLGLECVGIPPQCGALGLNSISSLSALNAFEYRAILKPCG